jgi:hypothetical protein
MSDADVREREALRSEWQAITDRLQVLVLQNPRAATQLLIQIKVFLGRARRVTDDRIGKE